MKRYYPYTIIWLFALVVLATSCEKEEPDFYDKNENGVYFDYDNSEEFRASINFADHVLGNPQELPVSIDVKLLGYMVEGDRKAVLKTKAVEGYPEATVTVPDVVFTSEEFEKTVEITVARPDERDTEYAVCIYFDAEDPESQLGNGITGKEEFVIYVKEAYEPAWDNNEIWSQPFMYLGPWSVEKHIFMINLTQDNDYTANLYDWYKICEYNYEAVKAVRQQHLDNPDEPILIDIPLNTDIDYAGYSYDKPAYWGEQHDKFLGGYSHSLFVGLAGAVGANTSNEWEILGNEDAVVDLHKAAVKSMMQNYNNYLNWGYSCGNYQYSSWTPMYANIEYDVVKPYHWSNTYANGAGDMISAYYGEYSDEKYKFMIKTWLNQQGTDAFVLVQMFPVRLGDDWWSAVWDNSIGGEEQIKTCYKAFKEAYDAEPAGTYSFTFPDLELE